MATRWAVRTAGAAIAAALLVPRAVAEEEPGVTLRGGVYAPGLDEPVAGAKVVVTGPDGPLGEVVSDARGRWELKVSAAPMRVDVWGAADDGRRGLLTDERDVAAGRWDVGWMQVDRGATATVRVTGGDPSGAEVSLLRDGTANTFGPTRLFDPDACASPLAPGRVSAVRDGAIVRFESVPPGPWVAVARRDGAVRGWTFFSAEAGRTVEATMKFRDVVPLTVRLTDPLGAPQAGVALLCAPAPEDVGPILLSAATTATTGADGVAKFERVPAGTNVVFESGAGSLLPVASIRAPIARKQNRAQGAPDATVPLRRIRRTLLMGLACDGATGVAAPGAEVVVTGERRNMPFQVRMLTAADGSFEASIPADSDNVHLHGNCDGRVRLARYAGRTGRDGSGIVAPPRLPAFIALDEGVAGAAAGRVTGPDGPVDGATVTVDLTAYVPAGGLHLHGVTGADGGYAIRAPGTQVRPSNVHCPGFCRHAFRQGDAPGDFVLERGRTVRGRVVDADGRPVAGAFVGWEGPRGLTDGEGRFTIRQRQGPGGVCGNRSDPPPWMVALPGQAEFDRADTDLGDVLCPPGVTGRPASALRPLVPLADGDRSIDVAVKDETGAPIAGAAVSVRLAGIGKLDRGRIRTLGNQPLRDRPPEIRAVTDAEGRATVGRLFDAVWQVDVEAPGFGITSAPTDVPAPKTIEARLSPLHAFSGRVVLRSGEPIARAQVSFTAQRQGIPSSIVETSADGRFVFDDLPEGPISLVAEPTMFTPVSFLPATVSFSGADMDGVALRVSPARTIEGVVLGRGHPFTPGVRVSAHWASDQTEPVGGHRSTYAWTDAAGRYVLRGLAPGRWRLEGGARPVTVESGATGVSLVSDEQRRW